MSKTAILVPTIHLVALKEHVTKLISGEWMFMHRHTCESLRSGDYACSCGLDVALAGANKDVKRLLKHVIIPKERKK